MKDIGVGIIAVSLLVVMAFSLAGPRQTQSSAPSVDDRVRGFLDKTAHRWRDMNVPPADGEMLYDIVLSHGYTRALEIGTSTGLSGIYIAWALGKTGGKLITIEIDEARHAEAVENFREAGLGDIVDARLADAHVLALADQHHPLEEQAVAGGEAGLGPLHQELVTGADPVLFSAVLDNGVIGHYTPLLARAGSF